MLDGRDKMSFNSYQFFNNKTIFKMYYIISSWCKKNDKTEIQVGNAAKPAIPKPTHNFHPIALFYKFLLFLNVII